MSKTQPRISEATAVYARRLSVWRLLEPPDQDVNT